MGCDVGEDVAVEIGEDDDVEDFWGVCEFSGSDIDDPVFFFDFWVFVTDFEEDLVEKAVSELHDVIFGEAGDFLAIIYSGVFEGKADDAFGAWARDEFDALDSVDGLLVFDTGVEIFFIFANDD